MSVHIDRAHHHPRVFKRGGYWFAHCDRCGLLHVPGLPPSMYTWRLALIAALCDAGVQS